jgi:polysaccharide export outer membrane protein
MKFSSVSFILILSLFLFSCKTQQPVAGYLDKVVDTSGKETIKIPELKIQKGDLLSIQVFSLSTDARVDALYNLPCAGGAAAGQAQGTCGYLVGADGNIIHHRLGVFHADGITKPQLAAEFKKRLSEQKDLLVDPTISIRFLNYKITVLGEVAHPGAISIPGERVTILEAIGLTGDITQYGKKNEVKVVREINGIREIGIIDLTSKKMFESPFYNLMQNDVVLVEALPQKAKKTDQELTFARIGLVLSMITSAALVYNSFRRLN